MCKALREVTSTKGKKSTKHLSPDLSILFFKGEKKKASKRSSSALQKPIKSYVTLLSWEFLFHNETEEAVLQGYHTESFYYNDETP